MKEVKKPWGSERHFVKNKRCTVKILKVRAGQMLSLQKHKKRSELWYFLTSGIVQIGNKKKRIKKGGIVKIKKGQVHRLITRDSTVKVLEISLGKFEQTDEIRLEDKYKRK